MQKAIQQNARKTANHLQGYRTEALRKISGVKNSNRNCVRISAPDFDAKLAPIAGHKLRIAPRWGRNSLPRRILDEIWRRDRKNEQRDAEKPILRKTAPRTDETAPILKKWVRPDAFAFYAVPASIDGISKNDSGDYGFLRRHMGLIFQTEYAVSPNTAPADNRFSGVGAHPSLLTIQSIRMGLKFDRFPHGLFCSFGLLGY